MKKEKLQTFYLICAIHECSNRKCPHLEPLSICTDETEAIVNAAAIARISEDTAAEQGLLCIAVYYQENPMAQIKPLKVFDLYKP